MTSTPNKGNKWSHARAQSQRRRGAENSSINREINIDNTAGRGGGECLLRPVQRSALFQKKKFAVATLLSKPRVAASIDRSIVRKKRTFQRIASGILSRTPTYLPTSIKTKPPKKPHFTLLYCTSPSSISIRYSYFDVLEPIRVSPGGGESPYTIRSGLDLVEGSAEEKSWFYFFFFFFFFRKK